MRNAVIYARYSSHSQTEMSIEGQLAECRRYAEEHDLLVVQEYIDRAQSATTDKRPNFQRMIDDSRYGAFDIILVYQFDRFARNVNDSGYYRKILSERGVSVVSAMEHIASDSSGIITQGMIERLLDQIEDGGSAKLTDRLRKREEELESLNKQLTREQAKQKYLNPADVRYFLEGLRDVRLDNEAYRKMLIRAMVDKIYLYDDHFRILFNNNKRKKSSAREVAEVERYFDSSSETTLYAPPKVPCSRICR